MKTKHLAIILVVEFLITVILTVGFINLTNNSPPNQTHLPLYEEINAIKDRLVINITEPGFPNPIPECDFFELREEDSEDYFQTTVNYWVFQNGQETKGDIEAFVEIYNSPDRTDLFIVEVARNRWYELTVSLDENPIVIFPTITENVLSPGYITFEVEPKNV
jgi:hypothetical protein